MAQLKNIFKKVILMIVVISMLITFCAMPSSYAKLDLEEGEFYYAGTQKGQYTVSEGIFEWLLSKIGDIADWILGIITMGFRMVFVGWTALIEKMLTWALESTAGISVDGSVVESNTDLTAITDSSNNVTIESIVYNHVPALDANPFHLQQTEDELKYSGTGHILKCTNKNCSKDKGENHEVTECEGGSECSCPESCEGCTTYKNAVANFKESSEGKKPIIYQIKESVAFWYYVIRYMAIAAMLVVLVIVGIKMATSTIAQDKAVYKKMLVDWLVGMIIIFTMHYIMIFTFYISEELVNVIEKASTSSYKVQMQQLAEKDSQKGVEYTNEELELKIYEAIRTRAYDAKLINGVTGMIMYMTLVYFAFRYTIIYIKRFFTIIVLTIMSPGLGVAYALQKVFSGRQKALKNWMSEYVLNVIIQVVHALIYSIFISQALILSLESVSGIIIAFILMNYTMKADALFRKIFKISTGGLVDDTNNSVDSLRNTVTGFVGGKAALKTLSNTPYTKAIKGAAKAVGAVPFAGAVLGKKAVGTIGSLTVSAGKSVGNAGMEVVQKGVGVAQKGVEKVEDAVKFVGRPINNRVIKPAKQVTNRAMKPVKRVIKPAKQEIKKTIRKAKNLINKRFKQSDDEKCKIPKLKYRRRKASKTKNKQNKTKMPNILISHLNKATSFDTNFNLNSFEKGGKGASGKAKTVFNFIKENASPIYHGIYGNQVRNPKTGKKENDGSGYYNNFRPTKLFGLTDKDKELLKKQMKLVAGTFGGMASLFVGMSTFVAHPKVGMSLLASGTALTYRGLGKSTSVKTYKGKYTFSRFGIPTIKNMQKQALKKAQKECDYLMLDYLKSSNPSLYYSAKLDNINVAPVIKLASGTIIPVAFAPYKFMSKTNIGQGFNDLNDHWIKQEKAQEKAFKKDALNVLNAETQARMSFIIDEDNKKFDLEEKAYMKRLYESMGYDYDEKTGHLKVKENISEDQRTQEEFENELDEKLKNNGVDDTIIKRNIKVEKHLTDSEISFIDKEIDNILISMSSGKILDMNSEATLNKATQKLTNKLISSNIISENTSANDIFVEGKNGLKRALKQKANLINVKLEVAEQALEGINDEDKELIKDAISEISSDREISDYKQITAEEILNIVNTNRVNPKSKKISKKPQLTDREKVDYSRKVIAYLVRLENAKKATHNSKYKEKQEARKKVNNSVKRRKNKLKQVLEMTFSTDIEDATGNIIEQVNNIKETGGIIKDSSGKSVEITSDESNKVLEILFLRKELEEINNVAMEELKVTRGSHRFNQSKKTKSEATIDYYKQDLEIKRYAQANSEIYEDEDYKEKTNYYTEDQIRERERIEELEKTLGQKKKVKEKAEREVVMNGPIVDLNEVKKNLLNK